MTSPNHNYRLQKRHSHLDDIALVVPVMYVNEIVYIDLIISNAIHLTFDFDTVQ